MPAGVCMGVCLLQGPKKLYKGDIDAAFRRVPILPEHRKYANVIFAVRGEIITAQHLTMMFGSVASVMAWHRIACLLRAIGRRLLKLPLLCYVDDLFSVDRSCCAQEALECFSRLVAACLGSGAIAEHKKECGNPLPVLGVDVTVSASGACFWPTKDKVCKWTVDIERFLGKRCLTDGEASKLTGQLQFGCQHIFKRLGRAMMRPLIYNCRWTEIEAALLWWHEVLQLEICEERKWRASPLRQVHMFADARSTPPHVAAVLMRCSLFSLVALSVRVVCAQGTVESNTPT